MNKYYRILDKILATGKTQTNKKGNIQYLLNEQLSLTPAYLPQMRRQAFFRLLRGRK